MRKPTVIGAPSGMVREELKTQNPVAVAPLTTGKIVLSTDMLPKAQTALAAFDFVNVPSAEIVKIGFNAEQDLQHTLDGFLSRLDKNTGAAVFQLFDRLQKGVKDANLGEVLKKVEGDEEPGYLARGLGILHHKNAEQVAQDAYEALRDLILGRTKSLKEVMDQLERELATEMQRLMGELGQLETLKGAYRDHFVGFTFEAGVVQAYLEKARGIVEAKRAALAASPDVQAQAELQELEHKLQLLESRALALEGTYTRLPADAMVIQQIEQAGVATLQETATTASARFASIKMTLLALQGAFAVKGVQKLAEKSATLDSQLTNVRGKLMHDIVMTAANAPGDNRVAQAEQIKKIIADTAEIQQIVTNARATNEQKFGEARRSLAESRQTLAALSHQVPTPAAAH